MKLLKGFATLFIYIYKIYMKDCLPVAKYGHSDEKYRKTVPYAA